MPPSSLGFVTSLPQRLSSAYFDAIQFGHARRQLCFSLCMGIATTYISSPFQGLEMYFLLLLLDVCLSMPICFPSTARLCCFNVFFPQPRQFNANDQEWIIDGPLSRRREQSLHAELNLVGSIHLPDISYRRFYRRLPFGIQIGIIFQPYRHIKPHGLDESFSRFIGFYLLRVFLLNTISQYSLEGHLKITLLLYSQTLPFLKPFLENFLKKIKSL